MISIVAVGSLLGWTALADDLGDRLRFAPDQASFESQELTLDLAGIYGSRNRQNFHGSTGGLGLGVNYFFTKYLGVGADTYFDEVDFPNHIDASLLGRYPLEKFPLAPYGIAGFGRQFNDVSQWTAHLGLGAEYRFNRKMGAFIDFRHVFADKSQDLDLWRFGVRMGF